MYKHAMGLKLIKKDGHIKIAIYDPEVDSLRAKHIVFKSLEDISSLKISDFLGLFYRLIYGVDNPIIGNRNSNECFLSNVCLLCYYDILYNLEVVAS
jgi:hypothetical protein